MKNAYLFVSIVLFSSHALAADISEPMASKDSRQLGLLVAPKVGFFKSTSSLAGAAYVGAEVGYLTPLLDHRLVIAVEGTWYQPTQNGSTPSSQLTIHGSTADSSYRLSERQF